LKRPIGKQDHFASAYGNLNVFTFLENEDVIIDPVFFKPEIKKSFQDRLLLFYTKLKRDASEVLKTQRDETENKREVLIKMRNLVEPLRDVFSGKLPLKTAGEILHEGWILKSSLTKDISSQEIDQYYSKAIDAGAIGGKLLGAGGGGFLLFFAEPENHLKIKSNLSNLYNVPLELDSGGTRITYYDQTKV
jgi:D-glycero-alpha-D-manno-heptose-7-phosphate kinase